jgi:hypothetical protein
VVGTAGFEPATSASRTLRATKLRYVPMTGAGPARHRFYLAGPGATAGTSSSGGIARWVISGVCPLVPSYSPRTPSHAAGRDARPRSATAAPSRATPITTATGHTGNEPGSRGGAGNARPASIAEGVVPVTSVARS